MKEISFEGTAPRWTSATIVIDENIENRVKHAVTFLAGTLGNYYRWMMFVLSRFNTELMKVCINASENSDLCGLIPDNMNSYQQKTMDFLLISIN
jgi:hypothetical protein